MASPCTIELWGDHERIARAAMHAAQTEVLRIEAKYSRYRDDSVTTAINQAAGRSATPIDAETAALLQFAATCYRDSDGLFDITSGVLRRAWRFDAQAVPPSVDAVAALLPLIGWPQVQLDARSVYLPRVGMELDFGGFGKEYAADRAAAVLHEHDCAHALVNLGGDVRALDAQADGSPWRVAIRHPRIDGAIVARMDLHVGALATSGDYERFIEHEGQRYCHVLDPRTGWPVRCAQSVSVLSPLCVAAGAHATIAMLRGDGGHDYLEGAGVPYLLIARDGRARGNESAAR